MENLLCNMDLREYAKIRGVCLWEIARELGVNDGNFSRKLRSEFTDEQKTEIREIIDRLSAR